MALMSIVLQEMSGGINVRECPEGVSLVVLTQTTHPPNDLDPCNIMLLYVMLCYVEYPRAI